MSILQEIAKNKKLSKPVIYGVSGTVLSDEEKYFFSKNGCLGFIIFSRNIQNKQQLKQLTSSLKELMEGEVLILIDQEGGRVARLKGEGWKNYPNGKYFADLYQQNQQQAQKELFNNFVEIAKDLNEVGINVDCAPVLDILTSKTHQVIGDRAYGENAKQVSDLGKEVCNALLSQNVFPIIKHIPGHGKADCDSHLELPKVDATLEELMKSDFIPFKNLSNQKFAMTAHILFSKIDPDFCATFSKKVIEIIRSEIGFKNILMSDDISMKALDKNNVVSFSQKTKKILEAGCDLILHCNGNMQEMLEINSSLPIVKEKLLEKLITKN
jgi:beta-N-acetylhexosaminidase